MKKWCFFSVLILVLISCKDSDCPVSAGNYTELEVVLDSFIALHVSDYINIELIQTSDFGFLIQGGEHLIDNIHYEIRENTLYLRNENQCRWLRNPSERIDIKVFCPEIKNINFRGYGDVLMKDWELNTLSVSTLKSLRNFEFTGTADSLFFFLEQGSPDLYLSGDANYLYVYHFGTGKVVANDLKVQSVHFNHTSTADFLVYPKENLRVEIRSSGNTRAFHPANNVEIIQEGKGMYLEEF